MATISEKMQKATQAKAGAKPKAPAKSTPKAAKPTKAATKPTKKETSNMATKEAPVKTKVRRSPVEILDELKSRSIKIDEKYAADKERLEKRITELTEKNKSKVEAAEALRAGQTTEDIDAKMKELAALRRAMKKIAPIVAKA